MNQCDQCKAGNVYRFEWGNVCCRVRFLSSIHTSGWSAWLQRWRDQGDAVIASQVREELKAIWAARPK